jgi:hypothetical protein
VQSRWFLGIDDYYCGWRGGAAQEFATLPNIKTTRLAASEIDNRVHMVINARVDSLPLRTNSCRY